jgi:hypothetical protein
MSHFTPNINKTTFSPIIPLTNPIPYGILSYNQKTERKN